MPLTYPATLPVPQTELVTPFNRAQYSDPDRPREARALSLDRLSLVRATWPPLSPTQAAVFQSFWREDLLDGGAWFNAEWPLPQGVVPSVFRFIQQPRWRFVPGGRWRIEALLERRGRTVQVEPGAPAVESGIAWFDPILSNSGTLAHANSGTGLVSDFLPGSPVTTLFAGMIGWVDETLVWSIVSWTSGDGHPSPTIADSTGRWVQIQWQNTYGGAPPVGDASIGTLLLTASINGVPVPDGERLIAVSSPAIDYPSIAWGPE